MTFYGQTDSRWGDVLLGYNTDASYNLRNFGCVVTAYANLLMAITGDIGYTPPMVNQWMVNQGGFLPGGGIFDWNVALGMGHVTLQGVSSDLGAVNTFLQQPPNFAILGVNPGANGQPRHFVLAPWVNKIVDSEDGQVKSQSTYPFVSAHLYTSLDPVPAAPAPPPPPTSGSLNATVKVMVPLLNARTAPTTDSDIVAVAHYGSIHVTGWANGQSVTVGKAPYTRTDNVWLKTDAGHFIAQAGTDANYGHVPARLTATQKVHLAASGSYGLLARMKNNLRSRKK